MNQLSPTIWEDLLFLPFVKGGRGPEGYDCLGLLLEIHRRMGKIITDDVAYIEDPVQRRAIMDRKLFSWRSCAVKPGAGLLFRSAGCPDHVGVAIDSDQFIHASESAGQVCLSYLSRHPWKNLFHGAFEPKE